MASFHDGGFAATIDKQEVQHWTRVAAEKGLVEGELMMSQLDRVSNSQEADGWLRKAAGQGSIAAMEFLAQDLADANERNQNLEALRWWKKAASLGSGWAQLTLGDLYAEGNEDLSIKPDLQLAKKWYTLAATGTTEFADEGKRKLADLNDSH